MNINKNRFKKKNRAKNKGVTLIELLIVITIMMTMISLVAPLAISTIDKAEAQNEFLSFCNVLRRTSVKAFANGSGIELELKDNKLTAYQTSTYNFNLDSEGLEQNKVLYERSYKFLTFQPNHIFFNKNGIASLALIKLNQQSRKRELDLLILLES